MERGLRTLEEAAQLAGTTKATLSFLLNEKPGALRETTLRGLLELVPEARHSELRDTLLSPFERGLEAVHGAWMARELLPRGVAAYDETPPVLAVWQPDGVHLVAGRGFELLEAAARLWPVPFAIADEDGTVAPRWFSWWMADYAHLMLRLGRIPRVVDATRRFERALIARQHIPASARGQFVRALEGGEDVDASGADETKLDRLRSGHSSSGWRAHHAWIRVLEPLLDGRCSGGIERLWEELSDEELYVFITAGFRRELILLNRAPDMQRARQVGAATPADLRTHVPLWDATTFRLEEAQRAVSAASRQRGGARNRRSR
ncbi:hypothetical protein J421_0045 [Gemmatirosa kalamazoonensis]|uniref:Uncharacterized protein n=1 Tax=Gemmatirosa kalamazoonensis TaxID=861299 RepID=W0RAU1_9BACT|nr:hypothetical protein J421_0023 [Gemmatirosa kalamazoonensis]AHG87582.1 hypothetical protein J421_0045 [Gemmatirosa kalamazoonensis]